nr:immunoglobulin light chain junction region [Macaca mulatta]MPN65503.1 immunoglobulin light chain junction region [Macaca mulatta]MPN65537.1 immunoglobulin light chain junction region [Macaca mulatta]MPN66253.1 immunoglobulin light chain junction region [Macaca mulatta]MPN66486.1 immunoglobulin light chain junction region [Macaca mulatta]
CQVWGSSSAHVLF